MLRPGINPAILAIRRNGWLSDAGCLANDGGRQYYSSAQRLIHLDPARGKVIVIDTPPCTVQIPDRVVYRHASGEGRTVMEYEPGGRAADDIRQLYDWTCRQVGLSNKPARKRTAA